MGKKDRHEKKLQVYNELQKNEEERLEVIKEIEKNELAFDEFHDVMLKGKQLLDELSHFWRGVEASAFLNDTEDTLFETTREAEKAFQEERECLENEKKILYEQELALNKQYAQLRANKEAL
ncbi:DUF3958 family protein [Bacillus aquiflavi]|uniref:DUF3958 domain-containing protein n=1 Tax=Bacillus aquiflavi TaxID=2672567 RepID=A0A6B3VZU6_9BACI|nr:DUF3958 family protein [Bacillus aquiflavi]MBA4536497.1 DUF3958 family protein [Bacillus aquiflavi]NEY80864.1 DUF3958 domain-containing protein [Bacillus aquiflavi]UAC47383.1 DUF3958 family protein [Bacillus aquiflavi]